MVSSIKFIKNGFGVQLDEKLISVLVYPGQVLPVSNESHFQGKYANQKEFRFSFCSLHSHKKADSIHSRIFDDFSIKKRKAFRDLELTEFIVQTEISIMGDLSLIIRNSNGKIEYKKEVKCIPLVTGGESDSEIMQLTECRMHYLEICGITVSQSLVQLFRDMKKTCDPGLGIHFLLGTEGFLYSIDGNATVEGGYRHAS